MDDVLSRYKTMFDANDPSKGGSFYIQSKVLRAKERLEMELTTAATGSPESAEGSPKTNDQTTTGGRGESTSGP